MEGMDELVMTYTRYRLLSAEAHLQSARKILKEIDSRAGEWQIDQALEEIQTEWGVLVVEDES